MYELYDILVDGLLIHVVLGAVIMRASHHEPELRRAVRSVVLKVRSCSPPLLVRDTLQIVNTRRASRLPIHAIENDEKDVFSPGLQCSKLKIEEVRLVHVFSVSRQCSAGNTPVQLKQLALLAVHAVLTDITTKVDAFTGILRSESVDRHKPIRMRRPLCVLSWLPSPVTGAGLPRVDRGGLQLLYIVLRG